MSEQPQSRRGELREDPLLRDVDPAMMADAQALHGFLGRSTEDGFWRLYLNPSLDAYLEIRDDDITAFRTLGEESSSAGTIIWVRRDAKVRRVMVGPLQAHADFLRGDIARGLAVSQRVYPDDPTSGCSWPTINFSCWTLCNECWPAEAQARRPGR
jgi:hypothetical protein